MNHLMTMLCLNWLWTSHWVLPPIFHLSCPGSGGEDYGPGEECVMRIRRVRGCCLRTVISGEVGAYGKGRVVRTWSSSQLRPKVLICGRCLQRRRVIKSFILIQLVVMSWCTGKPWSTLQHHCTKVTSYVRGTTFSGAIKLLSGRIERWIGLNADRNKQIW